MPFPSKKVTIHPQNECSPQNMFIYFLSPRCGQCQDFENTCYTEEHRLDTLLLQTIGFRVFSLPPPFLIPSLVPLVSHQGQSFAAQLVLKLMRSLATWGRNRKHGNQEMAFV